MGGEQQASRRVVDWATLVLEAGVAIARAQAGRACCDDAGGAGAQAGEQAVLGGGEAAGRFLKSSTPCKA